jgi:hypothetical protein
MALYSDGQYKAAKELFVQVMEMRKRVLSDEHPLTLNSIHDLAYTLWSLSHYEKALVLMEMCSQLRQQVLGKQHPDTQSSFKTLDQWQADPREGR